MEMTSGSVVSETKEEMDVLFRLSNDPFVNLGATEISRILDNEGLMEITPTKIFFKPDVSNRIAEQIKSIVQDIYSDTHRRSNTAHQLNYFLDQGTVENDDIKIPRPTNPFPEDETIFEDDIINPEQLENLGINPDDVEIDDDKIAYTFSPTYVGNPQPQVFPKTKEKIEHYLDVLDDFLSGDVRKDEKNTCMNCGSSFPIWKAKGEYLEHNQALNILVTKSGSPKPLGQKGSQDSNYRGRCVLCLIAGFYYTLMDKPVRNLGFDGAGVYRVFTPEGDFESLSNILNDLNTILEDIDEPTSNNKSKQSNIGSAQTNSEGIQALELFNEVLKRVNTEFKQEGYKIQDIHRPTNLVSYITTPQKGGRRNRDIRSVSSIESNDWIYRVVDKKEINNEEYWPVDDVLSWFANINNPSTKNESLVPEKDMLAYGIIEKDLGKIEQSIFDMLKQVEKEKGENTPYTMSYSKTNQYFSDIMKQIAKDSGSKITEEEIESISRVASNLGGMFYERDDISILISLQNANTPPEFMQALEEASMRAQKKITEGGQKTSSQKEAIAQWSGKKDVQKLLKLINEYDTFEEAKRMFVVQASLSAHYQNSVKNRGDEE